MKKKSKIIEFPQENIQIETIKSTKKKKRKINFVNLAFLVFVLYFLMTTVSQKQMINSLGKEVSKMEAERDTLKAEAEGLKEDVEKIDDQTVLLDVVERIARNEYKMVKPNEIIYIDKNKANNKFIMGLGYTGDDSGKIEIDNNNSNN